MSFIPGLNAPPRLVIDSNINLIVDGNSIYTDYAGTPIHTLIGQNELFSGKGATLHNVAASGYSWIDMIANGNNVDSRFDSDKTNILVCAETANACNTGGFTSNVRTGEQAWSDCVTYVSARKAANPKLRVILCGTTPSNIGSTWESRVQTFHTLAKANYRSAGIEYYVDFRTSDSPAFNHTGTLSVFEAYSSYWADAYLHLTTTGKTEMARQICKQGISKMFKKVV